MSPFLRIITLCVSIIMSLLRIVTIITYYYVFETGQLADGGDCAFWGGVLALFCGGDGGGRRGRRIAEQQRAVRVPARSRCHQSSQENSPCGKPHVPRVPDCWRLKQRLKHVCICIGRSRHSRNFCLPIQLCRASSKRGRAIHCRDRLRRGLKGSNHLVIAQTWKWCCCWLLQLPPASQLGPQGCGAWSICRPHGS